ncbi:hypothetical protein [Ancylobacter sp. IITR112]|uniref:hypothetical protein n=1 Tax=Ancylobacter sp. IITR112 TaxID=3138073 RepID=UPI00352A3589
MISEVEASLQDILGRKRLSVLELRTFSTFSIFSQDGKRVYGDPIADLVAEDIQSLILHHMPSELRDRFASAAVPSLDPGVRAIANGNANAAAFYRSLAVPFISAMYGADRKTPEGRTLNARRACRLLGLDLQAKPIFVEQQEQLYRYRLATLHPRLKLYLDDQANGMDDYSAYIQATSDIWSKELAAQFAAAGSAAGDADRKVALDHVKTAARKAQRGAFWAWALYRELLRSVPSDYGPEAIGKSAQNEDAALRIRQAVTLLDALDPSKYFSRHYVSSLSAYVTASSLAAQVDVAGNAEEIVAYAQAALEQFATLHGKAEDEQLRMAASIAQRLASTTGRGTGEDPLGDALRQALVRAGKLEGSDFVDAIEKAVAKMTGPKIQPWLATAHAKDIAAALLKGACGVAALALVISGGSSLHSLPAQQRVKICVGIGVSLSHSMAVMVRGSFHTFAFFTEHAVNWSKLGHTWTQWKTFDSQAVYSRGFAGWVVRNGSGKVGNRVHWSEHTRALAMPGAHYDYAHDRMKVSRVFGRNLDEFMAYRIGAVIGVINLYLAISALQDASQPLDIAAARVSVASAACGLIGAAGGWLCSAFGRFTWAGQLSSAMSTLAFLATIAVVALVVLQSLQGRRETPSELRRFAEAKAKDAGLYMPFEAAIEYIAPSAADEGVRIAAGKAGLLQMGEDGALTMAPGDAATASIFRIDTNGTGHSLVYAAPAGAGEARALTVIDDVVVMQACMAPAQAPYGWQFDVTGHVEWSGTSTAGALLRASFCIVTAIGEKRLHLSVRNGRLVLSDTAFHWTVEAAGMPSDQVALRNR